MYCSLVSRGNCVVKEHLFNRMDSLLAIRQAIPEMAKLLCEVTQCAHTPGCMLQAPLSNLRHSHSFIHGCLAVHVPSPCLQVFTNFQEVCLHVEESQIEEVFRIMNRVNAEAQAELLQMLRALTSTKVRVSVCVCICVCVCMSVLLLLILHIHSYIMYTRMNAIVRTCIGILWYAGCMVHVMLLPPLQVNEIYLPLKRNQAFIIKFYSKNRELFERVLGQEEGKKRQR